MIAISDMGLQLSKQGAVAMPADTYVFGSAIPTPGNYSAIVGEFGVTFDAASTITSIVVKGQVYNRALAAWMDVMTASQVDSTNVRVEHTYLLSAGNSVG